MFCVSVLRMTRQLIWVWLMFGSSDVSRISRETTVLVEHWKTKFCCVFIGLKMSTVKLLACLHPVRSVARPLLDVLKCRGHVLRHQHLPRVFSLLMTSNYDRMIASNSSSSKQVICTVPPPLSYTQRHFEAWSKHTGRHLL